VARVVDLGAGTGGLTRLLVPRADEVVAVEPDARMRSVLAEEVPAATVAEGRGEDIPLPAGSAAAVLASSSWHWVDPPRALPEVARVLEPGGTMGALWGGPDPEGPFMVQAREVLAQGVGAGDGDADEVARRLLGDAARSRQVLELVDGVPFTPPVHEVFTWERAMTADDLVGLLGTFSWVILMEAADRERLLDQARRLLVRHLGLEGGATVDVAQRCDAWRTTRTG
jgi:SAM-dependent methyltransferase